MVGAVKRSSKLDNIMSSLLNNCRKFACARDLNGDFYASCDQLQHFQGLYKTLL